MSLNCVQRETGDTGYPPDVMVDTGTLTININNQGLATLSVTVTQKGGGTIVGDCVFDLGNGQSFEGYIIGDSPQEIPGTGYMEHRISALGTIV